jgi:hypothetical protein
MSNFINYANRLRQFVPALSPEQAEDYINAAWRDIRESNGEWTFLYDTQYWLAPDSITLTGLTVVQFSDEVGLTHTNLTQLGGLTIPLLTSRQLRFGLTGGALYGISSSDVQQITDGAITSTDTTLTSASAPFDAGSVGLKIVVEGAGVAGADLETTIASFTSPTEVELTLAASTTVTGATVTFGSTITLDRIYTGESETTQALCYRVWYSPVSTDFDRIDYVADSFLGYEFALDIRDRAELDLIDPRRGSVGQPYRLYFHHWDDDTDLPVYEMWPGPTTARAYLVAFWKKGTDFVEDSDSLPPRLSEELLLLRARFLAYEWMVTAEPDPSMRAVWMRGREWVRSRYSTEGVPGRALGLLDKAIKRDRSVALTKFKRFPKRYGPGWPWGDSNFMQSHAAPPFNSW